MADPRSAAENPPSFLVTVLLLSVNVPVFSTAAPRAAWLYARTDRSIVALPSLRSAPPSVPPNAAPAVSPRLYKNALSRATSTPLL